MARIDSHTLDSFLIKSTVVTLVNFGSYYGLSNGQYLASAQAYLTMFPTAPDGTYRIQPVAGGATYDVYCNMQGWEGGGWMRLNSSMVTLVQNSTNAAWSGQRVLANNRAVGCGGNAVQFTLTSPVVDYTNARMFLERTTTILQCSGMVSGQTFGGYYDPAYTGSATSLSMCSWDNSIWGTTTALGSGQKKYWVMKASGSNKFSLGYQTQCSYAEDTGQYYIETWVK